MTRANITEWDILIVGDGSGTGWNDASGFAGVLIDRLSRERKTLWGGFSLGSVNQAEVSPYWFGLIWFHSQYGKARLKLKTPLHVHVITDSQVTAGHGTKSAMFSRELPDVPQRPVWAGMREFGRMGYQLHWHWAGRNTSALNALGDLIAGLSRREIKDIQPDRNGFNNLAQRAANALGSVSFINPATQENISAYEINPDEWYSPISETE